MKYLAESINHELQKGGTLIFVAYMSGVKYMCATDTDFK